MGKTATADMFKALDIPVFDADDTVHNLQAPGGAALPAISTAFPGTVKDQSLNRAMLGTLVFKDKAALKKLEAIMHPLVAKMRQIFIRGAQAEGEALIVLDEPLLFETEQAGGCDHIVVVSAGVDVQKARVMARPNMTEEKFAGIIATQMSDADKRALADTVILTDKGFDAARADVKKLVVALQAQEGS